MNRSLKQFRQTLSKKWHYCRSMGNFLAFRVGSEGRLAIAQLQRVYPYDRRRVSLHAFNKTRLELMEESQLSWSYLVLVVGSCIIASLGLLANSTAVIIGAMLIAPLMLPIRGAAFGILEADRELIRASLWALAVGSILSILIAAGLAGVSGVVQFGSEVWGRTQPTLLDLGIAVTAGALAGVAKVEPKLSSTVAGTAIAVALMPPVCTVGLWLAQGNMELTWGALLLYLTNLFGITLSCMGAFVVMGYSPLYQAKRPISITLLFTALLVVPLGGSTVQLLRQNQLEASVKTALVDGTITFQRLRLIDMSTNWVVTPPEVSLAVYADEPVSVKQVQLLEEFLAQNLGQPFKLKFFVSQVEQITSDPPDSDPGREAVDGT